MRRMALKLLAGATIGASYAGRAKRRRADRQVGSSLVSWKRPMRDSGLLRPSEDAGSLAPLSPRAIGPYVGGATYRFVVSRWPWRLLAGPGSRIPSRMPSMQPEREWGARGSAGDTCTDRPRRPPCRARMLLSGTLIGRGRVSAHACVWQSHTQACARRCARRHPPLRLARRRWASDRLRSSRAHMRAGAHA